MKRMRIPCLPFILSRKEKIRCCMLYMPGYPPGTRKELRRDGLRIIGNPGKNTLQESQLKNTLKCRVEYPLIKPHAANIFPGNIPGEKFYTTQSFGGDSHYQRFPGEDSLP